MKNNDDEYIYMKVPIKYKQTHDILIKLVAEIGVKLISDCKSLCDDKLRDVITLWNMYYSAIANYHQGNIKESNVLIDYINKQLTITAAINKVDVNKLNETVKVDAVMK